MKSLVTAVALQAILLSAYLPLTAASAAPSSQDLVSAIEKAKVLSTGTRVAASVKARRLTYQLIATPALQMTTVKSRPFWWPRQLWIWHQRTSVG